MSVWARRNVACALWMASGMAAGTLVNACVKELAGTMSPPSLLGVRYIFSALLLSPVILIVGVKRLLPQRVNWPALAFRAA